MIEISTHTCGTKQSVEQAFMYKYNKSCDCPGYNRERGAFPLWRDNIYGHGLQPVVLVNKFTGFGNIFALRNKPVEDRCNIVMQKW